MEDEVLTKYIREIEDICRTENIFGKKQDTFYLPKDERKQKLKQILEEIEKKGFDEGYDEGVEFWES